MKKKLLSKYFLIILITFVVNVLVSQLNNIRIDFTSEKSIHYPKNKDILKKIDDKIFFKIYYSGKLFTPELKSFKKEINQLLISELKYYSKYIDYEFIDLYSIKKY